MYEVAQVHERDAQKVQGQILVTLAVLSVPLALLWPAGIVVAVAIAFFALVRMPSRGSSRGLHWASLVLALCATTLSLIAGFATALVGM